MMNILCAFVGCMLTVFIQYLVGSAVFASSIVGFLASCFFIGLKDQKMYSAAAFCGSFAGMTSLELIWNKPVVAFDSEILIIVGLFSLLVSTLYYANVRALRKGKFQKRLMVGFGGRLGTIAFISTISFLVIKFFLGHKYIFVSEDIQSVPYDVYSIVVAVSAGAAYLTSILFNSSLQDKNSNFNILIPSFITLVSYFILSKFGGEFSQLLSQSVYTGAFVGMSCSSILNKDRAVLAGVLSSILLVLTDHLFVGIGGKLGLVALISVGCLFVVKQISYEIRLLQTLKS